MTTVARRVLDRQLRLIEARDLEGLLGQYHEDAVLLRFDRTVSGRAALREHLAVQLAQGMLVRELVQVAETDDLVSWQAVVEAGGRDVRTYGALWLRGERIARQIAGTFPVADAAPAARRAAVRVDLEPYDAWAAHAVPDPRRAGREAVGPVLLEIVHAEGPVLAERAYRLYVRASGGKALTSIARAPLSGAAYRLRQAGAIAFDDEDGSPAGADLAPGHPIVLRPAGVAPVRVRELGPRALDEVPLGEIAELMRRLRAAGAAELPRAVLDAYGLVRMTAKAEEYLSRAQVLALGAAGA
ncbi:nuclear transport factor 2 family protein [Baekduia soli]|uniref:Nuclear transport factor 2 family protein n=1 Tax=Baekduia soli TaxID=496014 RepID=A0A5B8U4J4_9ACTN|nr:nuclear transport factor 2 family protein [Baekduia soli]QEC47805.1 nuclear transport factor 2 family protein [Baekduia soli]